MFLQPTIQDRETVSECSPPRVDRDGNAADAPEETLSALSYHKQRPPGKPKLKKPTYEESLLRILREKKVEEEIDEDKSFLLSLVPSFKKMNDDQKIEAKMEFLATIRRINQQKPSSHTVQIRNNWPENNNSSQSLLQGSTSSYIQNVSIPPSFTSTPSHSSWASSASPASDFFDL